MRESEDEEASSDAPSYHGESDSDPGDMPVIDRELSPSERARKKKEKPKTRSVGEAKIDKSYCNSLLSPTPQGPG